MTLVLAGLGAYVLAGFSAVPFHPDEATWIYMSSDLDLLLQGKLGALCYQPGISPDARTLERLRTAGLPRDVVRMGLLFAIPANSVRADWNWSLSWEGNAVAGALPAAAELFAARLPMALSVVLALVLVYGIGTRLAGRWAGLLSAFAFGSNALVLLHGRRVMSEGLLLAGSCLTIWAAMRWRARASAQAGALGLAAAAKHTGAGLLPVSLATLWPANGFRPRSSQICDRAIGTCVWRPWSRAAISMVILLLGSVLVFGLFNPVGWCHPIASVAAALSERERLLTAQSQALTQAIPVEVVSTPRARLVALLNQTFFAPPAFWDIPNYAGQTAVQERAYQAGVWGGLPRSLGWGVAQFFLALLGLAFSLLTLMGPWLKREPTGGVANGNRWAMLLLLLWSVSTSLAILLGVPIQWQRYYVPLLPEVALFEALGLIALARFVAAASRVAIRGRS